MLSLFTSVQYGIFYFLHFDFHYLCMFRLFLFYNKVPWSVFLADRHVCLSEEDETSSKYKWKIECASCSSSRSKLTFKHTVDLKVEHNTISQQFVVNLHGCDESDKLRRPINS